MDNTARILDLARKSGFIRARDLAAYGIPRSYLSRLCESGKLVRVGRGLYSASDREIDANHSLAEAAKLVPHGAICLLSALRFHGITTQSPFEVWMAIDNKSRSPKAGGTPLHIVRFSGESLRSGIETHLIEGIPVRIYSPAKTVADCFKFRNKIGLDVALEALREGRRERKFTIDELWRQASICRVAAIMRPYLETLK